MTAIPVHVTAEQIAAVGEDKMAWAAPVEDAIAALTGVGVSIDGNGDLGNIATIGTRESSTLVVELPASINAWLNARWEERWDDAGIEALAFDLEIDDWLSALVPPVELVTLAEASRALGTIKPQGLRSAAQQRRDGLASETALAGRLGMRRIGRDWLIPRDRLEAEVVRRKDAAAG